MDRDTTWHTGEELAATYLSNLGWTILARNWRCAAGELDIVAREPGSPPVLVFCEVKCRTGLRFGTPLEAITLGKQVKLRELALHWLRSDSHGSIPRIRFDGVGVLLLRGQQPQITHVTGIAA